MFLRGFFYAPSAKRHRENLPYGKNPADFSSLVGANFCSLLREQHQRDLLAPVKNVTGSCHPHAQ
jgi:hypothetical protein